MLTKQYKFKQKFKLCLKQHKGTNKSLTTPGTVQSVRLTDDCAATVLNSHYIHQNRCTGDSVCLIDMSYACLHFKHTLTLWSGLQRDKCRLWSVVTTTGFCTRRFFCFFCTDFKKKKKSHSCISHYQQQWLDLKKKDHN